MRAIRVAIVVGSLGCYNPTPPAGAPCSDTAECPSGQQCVAGFCGGSDGSAAPDGDVTEDMFVVDAPALCTTWNARHFDPCMLPAPGGDLILTDALADYSWDTTNGALKGRMNTTIAVTTTVMPQTDGPDLLIASVENFTLEASADLDISGSRPLLIAVWGTATIDGDIDADASFSTPGPGGSSVTSTFCPSAPTGDSGTSGTPSRGGGGGAFQGDGGRGGNVGGLGGTAFAAPPAVIRGGCGGGNGGGGVIAPRGAGGGAIQITARVAIDVTTLGSIDAGGGAGSYGRQPYGGGGGGGAGGYIGLDAPTITVAGVLAANGGSGGGGASDVANGSSGSNGLVGDNAAIGGAGAMTSNVGACPRGGNGSAGATLTGDNAGTSACGGGGGGGAAGYVLSWTSTPAVTGTVSPPFVAGP